MHQDSLTIQNSIRHMKSGRPNIQCPSLVLRCRSRKAATTCLIKWQVTFFINQITSKLNEPSAWGQLAGMNEKTKGSNRIRRTTMDPIETWSLFSTARTQSKAGE